MTAPLSYAARILVVDDEPDLVQLVSYNLSRAGFKVVPATNGEDALELLKKGNIQLMVLDLMLPGIHGSELCRIVRSNPKTAQIPIIMLTARADILDKIQGIETGADDYMTKPFNPKELIARVNAVLRRSSGSPMPEHIITIHCLCIDKERFLVTKRGIQVDLSATEFSLLLYLAERRGRVFSRNQLLDAIWQEDTFVEPRTVDVHIRRLRKHIEDEPSAPQFIKTRRGVGYYISVD